VYCGRQIRAVRAGTTLSLEVELPEPGARPNWGSARFNPKSQLLLFIPSAGKTLTLLPTERTVLGRCDTRSTKVPDLDLGPYQAFEKGVSRLHAAISRGHNQALALIDLGSANHTFLNGEQLAPHDPRILRDGDEIRLGALTLKVYFK
jgi:pSer/pThr/pTyr-binding forkhead associated (FHA) protein